MMAGIAAVSVAEFVILGRYGQPEKQLRKLSLAGRTPLKNWGQNHAVFNMALAPR
jgi:hypothetical protein